MTTLNEAGQLDLHELDNLNSQTERFSGRDLQFVLHVGLDVDSSGPVLILANIALACSV